MKKAALPEKESERLESLKRYAILDSAPEEAFDDLTSLAASICGTPIALVSLVDAHRQWFKSKIGIRETETPGDIAFCAHGILQKDMFIVPDASKDERFSDNPLVVSGERLRFYAGVPLITADGHALGMLCVKDRIPRQLSVEQTKALQILGRQVVSQLELRRHVAELSRALDDRDRIELRLHQSEKMSALGQLASGVAHEINNPLGVIMGFAEGSLRRLASGDALEMPLKSIYREALRCKELVQDLLTFSRTSKTEFEPMDMNTAISDTMGLIKAKIKTTQVQIQTHLAERLPVMLGNSNQIQQIIINLATNAIDAMNGLGALTIITELLQEDPLAWIVVRIRDTGSGIPTTALPHIFEPYFTTKPTGQGTGLGLALIQEIVRKHSGLIDVKSEPGNTEFSIKFPVRPEKEKAN